MVSSTSKRRETPHLLEFSSSERRARSYRETTKSELFGKSRERRGFDGNSSISVSRWSCSRPDMQSRDIAASSSEHVVSVSSRTTRGALKLDGRPILHGRIPAGLLSVARPSQLLSGEFGESAEFVHFHARNDYLQSEQYMTAGRVLTTDDLRDLVLRDPLVEQLARTLLRGEAVCDHAYQQLVGQTLVTWLVKIQIPRPKTRQLPNWRLKRVSDYVDAHMTNNVSLADLASAAGLSRTYFAAQFRAAAGCRPHDFVLEKRIERAKTLLASDDMPLAEMALAIGFPNQAYFSTVFKKYTGETPKRWRDRAHWDDAGAISESRTAQIGGGVLRDHRRDASKRKV